MSKQPNYFLIGLFVLGTLALTIVGIIAVSADRLGDEAIFMETYLDESVMGLSVGSELTHRGVPIGRVERITFVATEYWMPIGSEDLERFGRYVLVVVAVDPKKVPTLGDDPELFRTMMAEQVKQGLRLKLTYQGITGLAVLETDYVESVRTDDLAINWEPKHIYVPSTPSLITNFTQAVDTVFQRLEQIDFEAVFKRIETSFAALEKAIQETEVGHLRASMLTLLDELTTTSQKLQPLLDKSDGLAANEIPLAFRDFSQALTRIEHLVARHEPDIDKVLVDLQVTTANLRQLSESLKNDPARLILSSPPERSEVVK